MEEKFGLITGIECKFIKTDLEIIESIATRTGIDATRIKVMMRYNIFTVNQFANKSGLSVSTVLNKTRLPVMNKENGLWGVELDFCFPFSDLENEGPKFIVRNEKSEKYLKV